MEELDKRLMPDSSVDLNSSHKVLEEILINPAPFMMMNQLIHQDSGTANLQQLTSNPVPLLPTSDLWFQLSWVDLIIMTLIMVILKFTLQIFQFNLTMNQFQI